MTSREAEEHSIRNAGLLTEPISSNSSQAIFFAARLIPSVLGLGTTAALTRLMEPTVYGQYALGLSIVYLMTIGAFEWLGLSLLRLAPKAQHDPAFFGTIVTSFLMVAAICCGLAILALLFGVSSSPAFVIGCLCAGIASAWTELQQRLQMAELHSRAYFLTSTFRGVIASVAIIGVALTHAQVPLMLFALAGATLAARSIQHEPRLSLRQRRFDAATGSKLFAYGLPLSVSLGLSTVLVSIDKWLLQGLLGSESVGLFAAAVLIAQVPLQTLANCIGPSTYALAVHAVEFTSPDAARRTLAKNFVILMAVVIPAGAGLMLVSDGAAHLVLGRAYWDAVDRLAPWLVGTAMLATVRAFYVDFAFQLARKTRMLVWITASSILVNVILDLWLIPAYAETGAAIGSFVACALSLVAAVVASRRAYRLPMPIWPMAKIVAATLAMTIAVVALPPYGPSGKLLLQIVVGPAVYGAAALCLDLLGLRTEFRDFLVRIRQRWALRSR